MAADGVPTPQQDGNKGGGDSQVAQPLPKVVGDGTQVAQPPSAMVLLTSQGPLLLLLSQPARVLQLLVLMTLGLKGPMDYKNIWREPKECQ